MIKRESNQTSWSGEYDPSKDIQPGMASNSEVTPHGRLSARGTPDDFRLVPTPLRLCLGRSLAVVLMRAALCLHLLELQFLVVAQ